MKNYRKLTAWIIAVWFILVCGASALQLYRNDSNRIGITVAISALAPIVAFAFWYARSDGFRRFVLSLNPRTLTYIHTWRVLGIIFVLLEARGGLPAVFALPAGYGDIAIGATASFVALRLANPGHRASFIVWQLLGIADLITAVGLGTTAQVFDPHASMAAMTALPLSLVPTFFVPLLLIFHLSSIAQARRWRAAASGQPTQAPRLAPHNPHPRTS